MLSIGLLGLLALTAAPPDRQVLLDGVDTIAAPGLPGTVAVFGDDAFPIVVGRSGRDLQGVVIGGTSYGNGRIIAFGHDGFFGAEALAYVDTGRLMNNLVWWLSQGLAEFSIGVVDRPDLTEHLRAAGFSAENLGRSNTSAGIVFADGWQDYDILAFIHQDLSPGMVEELKAFTREGGGLLLASTGWGWQTITGRRMQVHPLSEITRDAGLIWTDGTTNRTYDAGFGVATEPLPEAHAGIALETLRQNSAESLNRRQAVVSVLSAALNLPSGAGGFMDALSEITAGDEDTSPPSAENPVTLETPARRVAAALDTHDAQTLPVSQLRAHPAAEIFPGPVSPDAARVTETIRIPAGRHGWHSTGLYAAPGERITVRVADPNARHGLGVLIGAHTDENWGLDRWERMPAITRRFQIDGPETVVANAFGGLIYILTSADQGPTIEVTVEGAVQAPFFMLGETSVSDWQASIRNHPAPWAELATDRIVVTVPSEVVRELADPTAIMEFWNEVVDACAELAQIPRERARPERMVADQQIVAGYMHAGYPIMTGLDVRFNVVDVDFMRTTGSWGHFHEIGHNHQLSDWTFDGTVEVTVNLFSMYVYEKVLGTGLTDGHPAIRNREEVLNRLAGYLERGALFPEWQQDPFLALTMYIQKIEAFGWQSFRDVFAEYEALAPNERARNDDEKRDQWLVRYSRTVGRNLGPFFEAWGVPTSEQARASIADLPAWMPEELEALLERQLRQAETD